MPFAELELHVITLAASLLVFVAAFLCW